MTPSTSQIENLRRKATKGRAAQRKRLEGLDLEIAATDQEETRVLDAYREKVISMDQLSGQMAKVQEKRKRLGEEKQSIIAKLAKDPAQDLDKADVVQYAQLVRKRVKGLSGDFESKRRRLALLVNKIVLEGTTVRIKGVIPATSGDAAGLDPCRITSLSSGSRVSNTATSEFELVTTHR